MGDVAHILGIVGGSTDAAAAPAVVDGGDRAAQLLQALPKPVLDLLVTSSSAAGLGNKTTKPSNNNFDLPPLVPASGYSSSSRTHNKPEEESQPPTDSSHLVVSGDSKIPPETAGDHSSTTTTTKKDIVVKVGNKWIASAKLARPWVWAPFASSSRTDGLLLHHWVRANVEYPDYPFSRFDIHMDPVTYEEANNNSDSDYYQQHLQCPEWSKSETDLLLKMAQTYELRWPVIYDRWMEQFGYHYDASSTNKQGNDNIPPNRKLENLQHRYYSVAATLLQLRISAEAAAEAQQLASQTAAMSNSSHKPGENATTNESSERQRAADALLIETAAARALATMAPAHQPVIHHHGSGTSNKLAFDLAYERERRAHMEALWRRTPAEEQEETALRKELKQVEAQLRKLKKAGLHIVAAAASNSATNNNKNITTMNTNTLASSRNPSRAATPINGTAGGGLGGGSVVLDPTTLPLQIDRAMAGTAPVAVPGTPYLQSARLVGPTTGGPHSINPIVWQRLQDVLHELKVPVHPLATKRACDLYDAVRRDTLLLLLLQKAVLQEEGSMERKRLQLAQRRSKTNATTNSSSSSTSGSPQKQPRAVVDEETLLGIAPPPVPSPAPIPSVATAAPGQPGGSSRGATAPGTTKGKSATGVASSGGGGAGKAKNVAAASASAATKTKTSAAVAAGDKPAPAVAKQSSGNTKSAAAAGKPTVKPAPARGKQPTSGGKQPRKTSTKRKRKTEASSAVTSAAALQPATTTTATTGVATASAAPPTTVPSAVAATTTSTVPAPSEKGVKRPKKTG